MKVILCSIFVLGVLSTSVWSAPTPLSASQMDSVTAGAITEEKRNNGGQEPQGQANGNGITTIAVNPAGHAPPGQN